LPLITYLLKNNGEIFYNIFKGKWVFLQFERLKHSCQAQPAFCGRLARSRSYKKQAEIGIEWLDLLAGFFF
jgi:hypothetical protein